MLKFLGATLVCALLYGGCASSPSLPPASQPPDATSASSSPMPSSGTAPIPTSSAPPATSTQTLTTPSAAPGVATKLPVKGSGRDLGTQIRMAPGPDGRLWISIPRENGVVVALQDNSGKPSPGWPILLPGVDGCDLLLPVADASVRVVCSVRPAAGGSFGAVARGFALDANGQSMPGWPVDIDDGSMGRMVGEDLTMLVNPLLQVGGEPGERWPVALVVIGADGTRHTGVQVPFTCCDSAWAISSDGIAYGTTHRDWASAASVKTDVMGFGLDGPRAGWPVTIDGNASELAFGPRGSVYMTVGSPNAAPARTVVLDRDGRTLSTGSADQAIVSTSPWDGAGADFPGPPIVAADGTAFIVSTRGGTTIQALGPTGRPLAGWPYRSKLGMEWTGYCGPAETGCRLHRTDPEVGSGDVLYVFHAASSPSIGGSMVAMASDGRVRDGWPVQLKRSGSMFWSMAVGPDGEVWALAIEPEKGGYSATILAIADDSTVLSATTIVEP